MNIGLKVERIENEKIFLKDQKGRVFIWPRDFLPAGSLPGDDIYISINKNNNSKNTLAKNILNEILNPEN